MDEVVDLAGIEVVRAWAPIGADRFYNLVKIGFYDDAAFFRAIDGFMVQGGGYDQSYNKRPTEDPIDNEADNGLTNDRGTVAMARMTRSLSSVRPV